MAFLLCACTHEGDLSLDTEPSADAGADASADAGAPGDAAPVDADVPSEVSLLGQWITWKQVGPTFDNYCMRLSEAGIKVERRKQEGYGEFIHCLLVESWTGDWDDQDGTLSLTPTTGRSERKDDIGVLNCDPEDIYAERDMSVEELADHAYLSGDFYIDEDGDLVVDAANGTRWSWERQ